MPNTNLTQHIAELAKLLRIDVLKMVEKAGSGHLAGSLGMADVFATLYHQVLKFDPNQPTWEGRDYFLLSNGHICPIWYATLAQVGYFDKKLLKTLRQFGSPLQGHPHLGSLPGVENTSGPLGQGLSQAVGLSLALKLDDRLNRVFVVLSDGEHQEGQTWEAYQFAGSKEISNLIVLIDRNHIQIGGRTEQILPISPLKRKLNAFRWQVIEVDGHNYSEIKTACLTATTNTKPTAIICHTIPGKGVSFMENNYQWHGSYPSSEQFIQALKELGLENPEEELW